MIKLLTLTLARIGSALRRARVVRPWRCIMVQATRSLDLSKAEDLDHLYQRVGRLALAKAVRVVGRREVAEEVVQQVFTNVWEKRLRFDDERAAYLWIFKAVHGVGIDYLRSRAFRLSQASELDEIHLVDNSLEAAFATAEEVRSILRELSAREATILCYIYMDGMTHDETGKMLGMSRKTVMRDLKSVEKKIARRILKEREP